MVTNLTNFQIVYNTALGVSLVIKKGYVQSGLSIFNQQLGYIWIVVLKFNQRPVLPEKDQAQLLLILETLAMAMIKIRQQR